MPLVWAGRLWAVLLVLTVALSALAPQAAPVLMRSGSAFSVDTVEVAVAPARPHVAAAQRLAPLPPVPVLPLVALVLAMALPAVAARALPRRPAATGPPLAAAPLQSPGTPRAPPHA